ncbi:hypothetical protein ACHQM5_000858 [Ranunculus cassubicifolius]
MENNSSFDFLQLLGPDVSTSILLLLDDPAHLVRASSVSRSWRQFVIENGFSKQLCVKLFPEVAGVIHAIDVDNVILPAQVGSSHSKALGKLEKDHNVYSILARGLSSSFRNDCISEAICATSTDNYPEESIRNTLDPRDRLEANKASYWSSKGSSDPAEPEKLTYGLISDLCFITEVNIQPFQAYFQYGFPIYSAKAVRFRMGHLKNTEFIEVFHTDESYDWTYVSPEFPMTQENCLQKFKLPQPVLCIGGSLQVELLGRVQTQEMDGLFYICVSHVQVVGRTLLSGFDVKFTEQPGKCIIRYCPEDKNSTSPERESTPDIGESSRRLNTFTARLMRRAGGWERVIMNTLLRSITAEGNDDSDNESDEEMVTEE